MIDSHNLAPIDTWLIIGVFIYLMILNRDRSKDIADIDASLTKAERDIAGLRVEIAHLKTGLRQPFRENEEARYGGHMQEEQARIEDLRDRKDRQSGETRH